MLSLRLKTPGPFWLEDLMYLAADELRRLPERSARAAARWRRAVGRIRAVRDASAALLHPETLIARALRRQPPKTAVQQLAPELAEPLEWSLATRALTESHLGAGAVNALHKQAGEQLDSASYVLARLRDELRPLMLTTALPGDEPVELRGSAAFETSLDALLALSRENAATRPKERALSAA
ncbi:hypothetical protein [Hyphomicrobium sp.]|uniref:hypothetical protein n=1 Tax=Hyphomicrobium sp. TaxID=82 RepID=UPI003F71CF97